MRYFTKRNDRIVLFDGIDWEITLREVLFSLLILGVMSFLLPRYLFMVAGPYQLYDNDGYNAQWKSQNDLSKIFRFRDGKRLYTDNDGWKKLQEDRQKVAIAKLNRYGIPWVGVDTANRVDGKIAELLEKNKTVN